MGKTNITKAAVALTAGLAAFGVTGFAVAQGGLTANLALSGSFFKITMGHLDGEGFSLLLMMIKGRRAPSRRAYQTGACQGF